MSHRGRAAAFLALAVAAATAAAAAANGYRASVADQYGELRPVLVTARALTKGHVIGERELRRISVRRIPARFIPPGALVRSEDALGRAPAAPIPAGSYLLDAQLRIPGRRRQRAPGLEAGLRPVEISVSGGGALAALGPAQGRRVDVVVTSESSTGSGKTSIAAANVKLLALEQGGGVADDGSGAPGEWLATLAVTREQALRLIDAESFARSVRLLPRLAGE
jgi:Flp pilus assembly protein CpaB